ncbi:MAG: hypothetical protein ACJ73N_11180 [Bryobacteraceae bacterium]
MKKLFRISIPAITLSLLSPFLGFPSQTGTSTAPSSSSEHKKTAQAGRSSEEIADAKAKGLVWVNSATRVYHKDGPLYGTTRLGKFMKEEDAKKTGYRIASENGKGSADSKQ